MHGYSSVVHVHALHIIKIWLLCPEIISCYVYTNVCTYILCSTSCMHLPQDIYSTSTANSSTNSLYGNMQVSLNGLSHECCGESHDVHEDEVNSTAVCGYPAAAHPVCHASAIPTLPPPASRGIPVYMYMHMQCACMYVQCDVCIYNAWQCVQYMYMYIPTELMLISFVDVYTYIRFCILL